MKRIFLLTALVAIAFAPDAVAQKSDTKVKATVATFKPGPNGKQTVTITLEIDKGWYLYANPLNGNKLGNEMFAENMTVVTFHSKGKVPAEVKYPKGKFKAEPILKDIAEFHIYQDKVTFEAVVNRGAAMEPLEVHVHVNACLIGRDGKTATCLDTGKIVAKIP